MAENTSVYEQVLKEMDDDDRIQLAFLLGLPMGEETSFCDEQLLEEMENIKNGISAVTECFYHMRRYDLLRKLFKTDRKMFDISSKYKDCHIQPIRILLLTMFIEMNNDDAYYLMEKMGMTDLPDATAEGVDTGKLIMRFFEDVEDDDEAIYEMELCLETMKRKDLLKEIKLYKESQNLLQSDTIKFPISFNFGNSQKKEQPSNSPETTGTPCTSNTIYRVETGSAFGFCLIIHNDQFTQKKFEERKGSKMDMEKLKRVFGALKYDVQEIGNHSKQALVAYLKELQKENFSKYNVLVVAVLSHGKSNCFYASDGEEISIIKELKSYFLPTAFLSLKEKPKVFFIQACQGKKYQTCFTPGDGDTTPELASDGGDLVADGGESLPAEVNFYIASSTVEDYLSLRHVKRGSWFIQTLCKILEADATKKTLHQLMLSVKQEMAKKRGGRGEKQAASSIHDTLLHDFKLAEPKVEVS